MFSIIIAARNEHHNLLHHLPSILEQEYPGDFEVLIVNDQSVDDSEFYLKNLSMKYEHLKVVHVKNPIVFFTGKKFPLSIGIKSASYNTLLLTDADCVPSSKVWLKTMAEAYSTDSIEMVLGYGAYKIKKGLLNYILRFETLRTAIHYFGFASLECHIWGW
jgi:glycosyltransferase involved in cell wall biosynthesis